MKKILLIGAINYGKKPEGGEEYKNQLLQSYLNCNFRLKTIDTLNWQRKPFTLFNLLFSLVFINFNYVIISASSLSTYRLLIFIHYLLPNLKNKIIYSVIGGYFPEGIRDRNYKKKYYINIKSILVEGNNLKDILANSGVTKNVKVVPNYKSIYKISNSKAKIDTYNKKFVFISSISKEKGVNIIFDAVKYLLSNLKTTNFNIDFYGPIDHQFKKEFDNQLKSYQVCCKFAGYLDIMGNPEASYEILAQYNAMLFPTTYKGEGFPGVILDAYIAGLPVIASDWHMNKEVVKHGITGLIVKPDNPVDLATAMKWVMESDEELEKFRSNSRQLANSYDVNKVLDTHLMPLLL